jgi:signal transduction histidine kinase
LRRSRLILNVAFGASLCFLLVFAFLCYERFSSFLNYSDTVDHSYGILFQLDKLIGSVKNAETGERGYLITRDTTFLEPFGNGSATVGPILDSLQILTRDDPRGQQRLQRLDSSIRELFNYWRLDMHNFGSLTARGRTALMKDRNKRMEDISSQVYVLQTAEGTLLDARSSGRSFYKSVTPSYFLVLTGVAAFITILSFFLISRELRERTSVQQFVEIKLQELNTYSLELEQITFAASHDFQEPLRKISTFSNRLMMRYVEKLDPEGKMMIQRIDQSAARMRSLLNDLVNFSNLVRNKESIQAVDTNGILHDVMAELEEKIRSKGATVHCGDMPVIRGYKSQLHLLLKMLLDNALKFGREGLAPVIRIDYLLVNGEEILAGDPWFKEKKFHRITIEDNGIGFNDIFAEKMFKIFQRLHNQSEGYEGTGLGLAICQRVVVNHQGYIRASGRPGKSATFYCYLLATL